MRPATIGTTIMFRMSHIIFIASMGTYSPARYFTASGLRNGESSVETAVIVTDSGTLPPAR
jgi:hypothetical protein